MSSYNPFSPNPDYGGAFNDMLQNILMVYLGKKMNGQGPTTETPMAQIPGYKGQPTGPSNFGKMGGNAYQQIQQGQGQMPGMSAIGGDAELLAKLAQLLSRYNFGK